MFFPIKVFLLVLRAWISSFFKPSTSCERFWFDWLFIWFLFRRRHCDL